MKQRPLNVLVISRAFYPDVDGSVIAVSDQMRCLHEHGHVLRLITRKLPRTKHTERWQDISITRVGPIGPSLISRLMLSLNLAKIALTLIKKEYVDIIHAHGFCSLLAGLIVSKLSHKPIIVTFHGFQRLWFKAVRWRSETTFALTYPIEKFLINHADAIVAQSRTLKKVITQMYGIDPNKVHVIPHVVDEGCFRFVQRSSFFKPIALFVGTLLRVHGIDVLVKAAPIVLKDVPQAKFLIVGKGPQKEPLQKLIKGLNLEKSVFLVGPIFDRSKLARYYAAASVAVIPEKYEGYFLSLVALEAMSTGRPIVTTWTLEPGLRKYGVHAVGSSPEEIAEAIKEILLLDKETHLALSMSARRYIEDQCSREIIASRLEDLYARLIKMR